MKYIVIGPDGSGKSTFCKGLSKNTGIDIVKCSNLEDDKIERSKYLLANEESCIYDRFYYPDEMIYQTLKKGDKHISRKLWHEWEEVHELVRREISKGELVILYSDQPLGILKERLEKRGDDFIEPCELGRIQGLYREWIAATDLDVERINKIF